MYHPLVYHLDLCTLSYHLYAQTLVWPFDPYYETLALSPKKKTIGFSHASRRTNFMDEVRSEFTQPDGIRYPPDLEPVRFRFDIMDPRAHAINHQAVDSWDLFIPQPVSSQLRFIYRSDKNFTGPIQANPDSNKDLYCFYGSTGLKKETPLTAGLHGFMGFVLHDLGTEAAEQSIHIVFRGSRSGSPFRYLLKNRGKKGNADWVSDLQFLHDDSFPKICDTSGVKTSIGFSRSLETIFPSIKNILNHIDSQSRGERRKIVITGHSLGGAYALLFGTAMVFGKIKNEFPNWDWSNQKIITYGAPACGNEKHKQLVNSKLEFQRVFITGDPIVTPTGVPRKKIYNIFHSGVEFPVGYYGKKTNHTYNTDRHEFSEIRRGLIIELYKLNELGPNVPGINYAANGTVESYEESFHSFYQKLGSIAEVLAFTNISTSIYSRSNFPIGIVQGYFECLSKVIAQKSSYYGPHYQKTLDERAQEIKDFANNIPQTGPWTLILHRDFQWVDSYLKKTLTSAVEWYNRITG